MRKDWDAMSNAVTKKEVEQSNNRERHLMNLFMKTIEWTILMVYRSMTESKTAIHGKEIQRMIQTYSEGVAEIPNSSLYPALTKLTNDGFAVREWEKREDPNKRHRRFYRLTPQGEQRYKTFRIEMFDKCTSFLKFSETILTQMNRYASRKDGEDLPLNVNTLLQFWVLHYLKQPHYALSLKREIEGQLPSWKVADGTLYPLLSELDMKGYIRSFWGHEEDDKQSRSVRYYEITDKGKKLKSAYGQLYIKKIEETIQKAQFTCDYLYNQKVYPKSGTQ